MYLKKTQLNIRRADDKKYACPKLGLHSSDRISRKCNKCNKIEYFFLQRNFKRIIICVPKSVECMKLDFDTRVEVELHN